MTQRVIVAVFAGLLLCGAVAWAEDVSIELMVLPETVNLGEPLDVVIRIINGSDEPLLTSDHALGASRMWAFLELTFIDEDGIEIPVGSDRPMYSPAPSSLWMNREGEQVAVRPAVRLPPGTIVETSIVNLLRYFPLVEPGTYRLSISYELPVFEEAFTSLETGDTELVVLDEADWQSIEAVDVEFTLALSQDITGADLAWFRDARMGMLGIGCGVDAVTTFSYPPLDASPTVRACSLYWIGEAYQLFWMLEEAFAAYTAVIDDYPDSLFAAYAHRRIAEFGAASTP